MPSGPPHSTNRPLDRLIDAVVSRFRPLSFRGKGALTDRLLPKHGESEARIFGSRFLLDKSDYLQRHIYAGSFEREETAIVRRILRPGMTFVDVGANVGYYTALAAQLVGTSGSVFAFEPSDYAYRRLQWMVEQNNLTQVRTIKCALADSAGDRFLYGGAVDESASDLRTATMVPSDNPRKALVHTGTLDDMAEQYDIRHIDFVKIDVDGFEPLVLEGAGRLMSAGRISNVMLEFAEYWYSKLNVSAADLLERMRNKGFSKATQVGRTSEFCTYLFGR